MRVVLDGEVKDEGEEEKEGESGTGKEKKMTKRGQDVGVLAATGASGALVGWCLAHTLNLNLDLLGAATGEFSFQANKSFLRKTLKRENYCVAEGGTICTSLSIQLDSPVSS